MVEFSLVLCCLLFLRPACSEAPFPILSSFPIIDGLSALCSFLGKPGSFCEKGLAVCAALFVLSVLLPFNSLAKCNLSFIRPDTSDSISLLFVQTLVFLSFIPQCSDEVHCKEEPQSLKPYISWWA